MVTPRQSQRIMKWGIESALGLIFNLFEITAQKLAENELFEYLCKQTADQSISKQSVSKTLYELKRHKYIDLAEGDSVVLTNKAKMKLIDHFVAKTGQDGMRRLVSFDIPETRRTSRNKFRNAIKKMGFVQIQKSLWVTDNQAGDMVELAAEEYKVSDYVAYFVIESSNIEEYIEKIIAKQKPQADGEG